MRVLTDIGHPSHVHLFRHAIALLEEHGHSLLVTASEKEKATKLLRSYNIPYVSLGTPERWMAEEGARLAFSAAKQLALAASSGAGAFLSATDGGAVT